MTVIISAFPCLGKTTLTNQNKKNILMQKFMKPELQKECQIFRNVSFSETVLQTLS